jgi:hypothetical protein
MHKGVEDHVIDDPHWHEIWTRETSMTKRFCENRL